MGRRDKAHGDKIRYARFKQQRLRAWIKPPWTCLRCGMKSVYYLVDKDCIGIFCVNEEKKGVPSTEVMPRTSTYQLVDYYNFWCDSRRKDEEHKPPTFTFKQLTKEELEDLEKRTTLGKIFVRQLLEG